MSNRDLAARRARAVTPGAMSVHPIYPVKGEGSYVWDANGSKYLDWSAGIAVMNLGHSHPKVLDAVKVEIVVNTGDDFWHLGLAISQDIDSVVYALAGLNDVERGWGRAGETWNFMAALEKLGAPTWFRLGDLDCWT